MQDNFEEQLTVDDILNEPQERDLYQGFGEALEDAEAAAYHTILEMWREVLAVGETERKNKITPQWANRICTSYQQVFFADMADFRDRYFNKVEELLNILIAEIDTDDECLNLTSAEEDVAHNSAHYLNVLINWQKAFLSWELNWNTMNIDAATELAAISEIHKMMFDNTGLTSLLDNIQFEFTDADRQLLSDALQEMQAASRED